MPTVFKVYERFITWLAEQAPGDDAKRLANIISQKLHELIPVGTAARKRSKILAPFAMALGVQEHGFDEQSDGQFVLVGRRHLW